MTEHAGIFSESLKTQALVEQNIFMQQFEDDNDNNIPDEDNDEFNEKLELLGDKEMLVQNLDTFKETMDNKISGCEKQIRGAV